jgi:hypothetical protein
MKAKLTISEGADPNYLPTVVKVPVIKDHPNADRLSLVEVFGNTIIIGKGSYNEGDLVVYFPVECAISLKFLSWANLRDNAELNADGKTKGFFGKHGRVKAIGLRSIPSQGFLFKVSELAKYYEVDEDTFKLGDIFDTVGEDVLAKKYVKGDARNSGEANEKKSRVPKWVEKTIGVMPRPIRVKLYKPINAWFNRKAEGIKSQLVDGQFAFHYKTEHLGRNIFLVNPDDFITVSSKMHGTSAIFANILCKKPFSITRPILNKIGYYVPNLGLNIPDTEYKFVYSSRSVLKNRRDGNYTDDVWGVIAAELEGEIPERYTVYGEIVGYTSGGATIQKGYDYGVAKGECEFRVYRITCNLPEGKIYELEWYEIEEFCHDLGLKTVPVYYTGLARDMFADDIPMDKDWNDNFLAKLKEAHLDKDCELCTTGVVNEGIVLRIENNPKRTALKFKSPKFVIKESAARDNNEADMEEES